MARNRFVDPETVRLPLSDGDWIEVKKRLNTGEAQDMFAAMRTENMSIDPAKVSIAKVQAYLLDWSFTRNGKAVPVSSDALRALDTDSYAEIREAINTHADSVEQEIDAEKKLQAGETPSLATSASAA